MDGVEDGGRKGCNAREMGGEKEQMLENFHSPPPFLRPRRGNRFWAILAYNGGKKTSMNESQNRLE